MNTTTHTHAHTHLTHTHTHTHTTSSGDVGVELHAGPVAILPEASLHVMLIQHLDWTSIPNPGNLDMELAISRDGGVRFTRPFRRHLGFPFFLPVNPESGKFDSGTMWTNAQFIPSKVIIRTPSSSTSQMSVLISTLIPLSPYSTNTKCHPYTHTFFDTSHKHLHPSP